MATLPINAEAVTERINAMRISAEEALSRVQTAAEANAAPLARVVVAYLRMSTRDPAETPDTRAAAA